MSYNSEAWHEFRQAGLLWWVNRQLHLFGWSIYMEVDGEGNIIGVYPQRCDWRGFPRESEDRGFTSLTNYLVEHVDEIKSAFEPEK